MTDMENITLLEDLVLECAPLMEDSSLWLQTFTSKAVCAGVPMAEVVAYLHSVGL